MILAAQAETEFGLQVRSTLTAVFAAECRIKNSECRIEVALRAFLFACFFILNSKFLIRVTQAPPPHQNLSRRSPRRLLSLGAPAHRSRGREPSQARHAR